MTSCPLKLEGYVRLPANAGRGAFDHAAVHAASGHVYVAHTANDAVDVFDREKHLFSIPHLKAVAGALVSDEDDFVFTSNRGENTVSIFRPGPKPEVAKIGVGMGPNGLAYDHTRKLLLAANVGDAAVPGSRTVTMVDVAAHAVRAEVAVPGRTRWTVFDRERQLFFVNIADPAVIAVIDARRPGALAFMYGVPSAGPHGLDLDPDTGRLFCACDAGRLITLDAGTGRILADGPLSGTPDVVFFNRARRHLYVAVGDPGVIDVFDTRDMTSLCRIDTEPGAHTTALSAQGDRLYAFLPRTHRAAVYAA